MKLRRLAIIFCLSVTLMGCSGGNEVVIYVSHDQNLSQPILNRFEQKYGIEVRAVYDTEANKTTGLVNRLLAEKEHPRADVFWNNEVARTILLKKRGVLAPIKHNKLANNRYSDPENYWSGFAARARVLIVNTDLVNLEDEPNSINDIIQPKWKGKCAIANPYFGTTGTHLAAILATMGDDPFQDWLRLIQGNEVAILPGNAQVKNKVAIGEYAFGITDTDDAYGALLDNKPVKIIFPDQMTGMSGVFVIPNTVALIHDSPNPENGEKLISYLLSESVEKQLSAGRGAQIPIRHQLPPPPVYSSISNLKLMQIDYVDVENHFKRMIALYDGVSKH